MESNSETTERSFEEMLSDLQSTVERLESGNLTLDESMAAYEEAVRLASTCQQRLDQAELRITTVEESLKTEPEE